MNKDKMIALTSPLAFLVFGIWIRFSTLSMTKRDSVFPNLVAYMVIIVSIIDLISVYRKMGHKNRFKGINTLKLFQCLAAMFLYVFLLKKIGFVIDTLFLTAFTMWVLDYRNYKILPLVSILITAVVFFIFYYLLNVPLPTLWL